MTTITDIVNSTEELAAFPLTGNVAFFISGPIDYIQERIAVIKKDTAYPDNAAYLYSQYGKEINPLPEYNVNFDSNTNKVTISFGYLEPAQDYKIIINLADVYGTLASSTVTGAGSIIVRNYFTGAEQATEALITILEDSIYDSSKGEFRTKAEVSYGVFDEVVTLSSSTSADVTGLSIMASNDPFLAGDTFLFTFNELTDTDLSGIDLTSTSLPNTSQILDEASTYASEIDLINFYAEENQPVSPEQPTTIRRILKSTKSMIIEFTEPVDLSSINATMTVGPAFNMVSLPEEEWTAPVRVEISQLTPVALIFRFMDSTTTVNEVVKNV